MTNFNISERRVGGVSVLDKARLLTVFDIYENESAALDSFKSPAPGLARAHARPPRGHTPVIDRARLALLAREPTGRP